MNDQHQVSANGKTSRAARIELLPPSMSMRAGKRLLTLSWRPRKQLPPLLSRLLQRSWRTMFARSLRISVAAAAVCAAWNAPALAAAPAPNTLPTGGAIVSGSATITQNGNTLNINQSTNQAIGNFASFSIGSNAVVDISQPNAAAAFLARVTGSDPSLIYGMLKANGTVALINQNGILVGPTGVVDVARFIASTLNISDSDFLAGKLTFNKGSVAGNVENQGTIKTASGGSVYLIGANVDNSGVITSPNGEILLAAGQTVQLVDTGTPGVTVNVTGTTGTVTNLGTITAEAGRIGIAAGLINNSGNLNASSVVSDGGRIFLRASQNLTTTATSKITADGAAKGGSVVLYSDKAAYLDGDISAIGAPGQGGYVETSGKQTLDVVKLPTIGSGGTWLIDPYDLEVVSSGGANYTNSSNVISSSGASSKVEASTINTALNGGTSVTLVTGDDGVATGGNITISANIEKTSGSSAALTMNADNNININANITSTSGALGLNLNTNYNGNNSGSFTTTVTGGTIQLNGGVLTSNDGTSRAGNGNLALNNGAVLDLGSTGTLNAGNLTINAGATLNSTFNAGVNLGGALTNGGTLNLQNSALTASSLTNSGSFSLANVSGSIGAVINCASGTMSLASIFGGVSATTFSNLGTLTLTNGSRLNTTALTNSGSATFTASVLNVSAMSNTGTASFTDSSVTATDTINNAGQFSITNGTINTANGFTNLATGTVTLGTQAVFNDGAVSNLGILNANGSNIDFEQGVTNAGTMSVTGTLNANGTMSNALGGIMNLGGASQETTISGSGNWFNDGTINVMGSCNKVSIASLTNNQSGAVMIGSGASLSGNAFDNSGTTVLTDANMSFSSFVNNISGNLSGTGTINVSAGTGTLVNSGTLAPGGDGATGMLTINGGYQQSNTGTLLIDISSTANDVLAVGSSGAFTLNGTLQTKLLGGYAPALGTSFAVITGPALNDDTGVFRHVSGDVLTAGGAKQMIKPIYNKGAQGLSLSMSGSENITFSGESWGNASSWSTYYFPTAIDNVIVPASVTLQHSSSDGVDSVNSIMLNNGAGLTVGGGTLKVGDINSGQSTSITVQGNSDSTGVLNVSGSATTNSLTVSGTGVLNGGANSTIRVTDSFSQNGGNISSLGDIGITQTTGDIVLGNISARNMVVQSKDGMISQAQTQVQTEGSETSPPPASSLHISRQLITSSATGTTLDSSANQIAAYAGNNNGSGNIVVVNHLNTSDTSAVTYNGITNNGGNITVDNIGAARTDALGSNANFLATVSTETLASLGIVSNGAVSASGISSNVALGTHSPLTIGSGGVTASGGITLSAGTPGSGLGSDSLVINGVITSTGSGTIILVAGGSIFVNANIFTHGIYSSSPVPSYLAGVSITDLNGTIIPVPQVIQQIISPLIAQAVAPVSNSVVTSVQSTQTVNTTVVPPTLPDSSSSPVTQQTMTTGGDPGTFGGSEDASDKPGSSTTKTVVKTFCN